MELIQQYSMTIEMNEKHFEQIPNPAYASRFLQTAVEVVCVAMRVEKGKTKEQ